MSAREWRSIARAVDAIALRKTTDASKLVERSMSALTRAADSSKLWIATAAVLAAAGGRRGRNMAARGLVAIAASGLVGAPLKHLVRRPRPHGLTAIGFTRAGRTPRTSSFPSGHAASAVAFATAAGLERPALLPALEGLALAVAWSRVQSGQHYPGDILAGATVGAGIGVVVHLAWVRHPQRRKEKPMGKTAREIMSTNVECIGENDTVLDAAKKLADIDVGAMPICGEDNRLKGMLTDRDIVVKVLAAGRDPRETKAGELAQGEAVTIGADDSVDELLKTMAKYKVRRLPVIDGHKLVGIVSQADVATNVSEVRVGDLVEAISAAP